MPNLLKRGARKPRIEAGYCFAGNSYGALDKTGAKGMLYTLTVASNSPDRTEYEAQFTKTEALGIMADWLQAINRDERAREKLIRETAERDMRDSPLRSRS